MELETIELENDNMKENEAKIFEFEQHGVEIVFLNGKPLFNPYHVGKCLEMPESTIQNHLAKMNGKQKIILENSKIHFEDFRKLANRGEAFITEPGVYKLIFRSRTSQAERFQDWLAEDVLPSIRETGSYSISKEDQILKQVVSNAENLLGIRKREIAINQNESWNMKLAKLIWDCSKNKMGSTGDLYDELVYLFAEKTGFNINELAEAMGMTRQKYLIKNQEVCKTLYEFAVEHFYADSRQITLVPFDQKRLTEFGGK